MNNCVYRYLRMVNREFECDGNPEEFFEREREREICATVETGNINFNLTS